MKSLRTILSTITVLSLSHLHAQEPQTYQGVVGKTLADSKEWWAPVPKAPVGAPNVIWIILDDVGFGASSAFGGVIRTPTLDSLANNGLRYTNFHTCAICAPTRSALLTGRNSHFVHEGGFSHITTSAGFPGWDGRIPSTDGTIAEILRQNGYNTYVVGKYGLTPDEDATDAGPFDRWPSGKGFDHFFGFLGSQTDQYKPDLVEDNAHVTPDGRHLSEQITDKAISYLARQKKVAPNKPFFLYYSPAATHAPHQVDKYWSDQYKGKFDEGYDVFREKVLANQKKLGVVPAYAQLPPRNSRVQAWNTLSADQRKLYARFMEVYAGYLTYTDYQIGRVVNYLKESGQLDNTLIFVIIGDNGASKEGTLEGVIEPKTNSARQKTQADYLKANLEDIDSIGTAQGFANYPLGWAQAANTPFREWKQDADAEGGTHNPLIAFYPKGIKDKGGIRFQYGHVIDLLPTTLEVLGLPKPGSIRGIKQDSIQGTSLAYSFNDEQAASRHIVQHYYIFGSRAIYYNGWKAEAAHHPDNVDFDFKPGQTITDKPFEDDTWQLYNLNEDFNERIDLAKQHPEKLAELKKKFDEQAEQNHLYPLISWYDVYNKRIHHPNGSETQGLITGQTSTNIPATGQTSTTNQTTGQTSTAIQITGQSPKTIRITGTRLAYPLFQKWADEYTKLHPDQKFIIGKFSADSADLLIVSHKLGERDVKESQTSLVVTRYVQLPVVNNHRKDLAALQSKGFDDSAFRQVYFADGPGKGPSLFQFTVYRRQQPACASISFANHFGSEQKDIKGIGVTGDDRDLLTAVKKDKDGISYNNLGFLYDLKTRQPVDSIAIIPIDLNGNGKIDQEENFYGSLDEVINFVEKTHHPKIPLEDVHVLLRKGAANKDIAGFLQWIVTEGQQYDHAYGFINLNKN